MTFLITKICVFFASLNHKSAIENVCMRGPNCKAEIDFSLFNPLYFILQRLVHGESPGVHVAPWRS